MFALQTSLCCLLAFLSLFVIIEAGKFPPKGGPTCAEDCSTWIRCNASATGDKVFTIVDGQCLVFNNSCHFTLENCRRVSKCLSSMVSTTKAECQLICPFCGEDFETSNPGVVPPLLSEIPA